MKFIHTGDIHYGMKPDSNRPWGKERADAVKSSLQKIIDVAKKREVDLLLIAGDLFHSQPFSRDLKEVNFLFSTIPDTKVVIIAGNHDCLRENNNILSFPWAKNVVYLSTPTISSVYFQDINTEIYGFSYHDREVKENIVSGLSIRENDRVKILLLHGGDATHLPFDKNELNKISSSYIALGHIHKPEVLFDRHMAYCGSPEPLDMTETGDHGIFYGEIDNNTRVMKDFEFIKEFTPMFVKAGIFTVKLSLYGILLSLVIGIFCTLVKFYKVKFLTFVVNGYIEVSRNTPLLIQLFFLYYGLSKFGLNLSAFTCAVAGLAFLGGSYMAESFRLGFEAVKKTQIEAALSVALTQGQILRYVILPQAFSVSIPSIAANVIFLIKETSVISIIALPDLVYATKDIIGLYYMTDEALFMLVVSYLIIILPISLVLFWLEKRMRVGRS